MITVPPRVTCLQAFSLSTMSAFLDLYEPSDIIGNGSFGIIRKVRRKSDGLVSTQRRLWLALNATIPGFCEKRT